MNFTIYHSRKTVHCCCVFGSIGIGGVDVGVGCLICVCIINSLYKETVKLKVSRRKTCKEVNGGEYFRKLNKHSTHEIIENSEKCEKLI